MVSLGIANDVFYVAALAVDVAKRRVDVGALLRFKLLHLRSLQD